MIDQNISLIINLQNIFFLLILHMLSYNTYASRSPDAFYKMVDRMLGGDRLLSVPRASNDAHSFLKLDF